MTPDPQRSDVDELRLKLRSLGYLDAGVDRFVLAPVRKSRNVIAIAFRSSLRIGLLAGLLLGPAAAFGIGLRLPGLITSTQDAFVVAVYMGLLFGGAMTICAFIAALLAGMFTRTVEASPGYAHRARRLTVVAGALVGLMCLAYLTLWWGTAGADAGRGGLLWSSLALAGAVAISALMGRTVSAVAAAVIAQVAGAHDLEPRGWSRSWKASALLAGAAFGGATLLLLATAPGQIRDSSRRAPPDSPGGAVIPTGVTLTVIAIDGFDVPLYERLAQAGTLPHLSSIIDGAQARLQSDPETDPASIWTSIATGQPAAIHGVAGLETRRVAGVQGAVFAGRSRTIAAISAATDLLRLSRPAIASGFERHEKTFWEVAAEKGFRTAVINWWATWPATDTSGIIVSDRAVLRLEHGGALDAEIAPTALYDQLHQLWPQLREQARSVASSGFSDVRPELSTVLRRSGELDALQVSVATQPAIRESELLSVYLPGLDIAQFALVGSGIRDLPASALSERVGALERYYRYLDRLLEPLLASQRSNHLRVLITHPGRVSQPEDALFAVRGSSARSGVRLRAKPMDAAPTLLYAMGLPASRELAGQPMTELFTPEFLLRFPNRWIDSYGRRLPGEQRVGPGLDSEMVDRLRSLGYVR